jgi:hypothetical protein
LQKQSRDCFVDSPGKTQPENQMRIEKYKTQSHPNLGDSPHINVGYIEDQKGVVSGDSPTDIPFSDW